MKFTKDILEDEVPCPRCNADSQIRVEDQEDFCIIVHVCKYCRLHKSLRITTRRALALEEMEQKLLDKLIPDDKIEKNYKILARLERLQQERKLEELGLRSKYGRRKRAE